MNLVKKQSQLFDRSRILVALCVAAALLSLITIKTPRVVHAAAFTAGNLVVVRVGDGGAALSSTSAPVFLDEYTKAAGQVSPVQSIPLPIADSGANQTLTMAGSATSEGFLKLSTNNQYLTLTGYDAPPGTLTVASTGAAATNRVVARVDINGTIDTSTRISDGYDTSNIRSAISDDGTKFWTSGTGSAGTASTRFVALGASTSTQISAAPNNARVIGIFNNQLYLSSASAPNIGLNKVGSGIPTTTGQTTTNIPNTSTSGTGTPSNYDYILYGTNTLYFADDRSVASGGGIQKWISSDGGATYVFQYVMNGAGGVRGLTGFRDTSGNAILFATTTTASANSIVKVSDPIAQTVQGVQPPFTTIATAPPNTAFRGIAPAFVAPTAADGRVTGRIADSNGSPIAGAVVRMTGSQTRKTITDANGTYRFDNVETNGFYTVAPSSANFSFNPGERSFSQLGNSTEATFTGSPIAGENPLDTPEYFVRQHYLDFLGREPDEAGFNFWSDQILACGYDAECVERRTVNVSAAYFLSIEFQQTGGLVDRLYKASYGRSPRYAEFMPDTAAIARAIVVGRTGWEEQLATNKDAFVTGWMDRAAFHSIYDNLANDAYVDTLVRNTGANYSQGERDSLVSGLGAGTLSRAAVLEQIANNPSFAKARFNEAFVRMEYFGYLRRDPDDAGFHFWLDKLNQFDGNFERADMVKAFIVSGEYRDRFARRE